MTQRMSTHELLELASLDALGLLSEEEREAFDVAFKAAPPALQAQLRAEQARMAGDDSLLPLVAAPVGLRARVLAAVREAVQSVGGGRQVAGRIAPEIMPGRGVSPIWRAAAIGCLAASIVFAFTTLQMRGEYEVMHAHLQQGAWQEQWMSEFGTRFEQMLYDPTVMKVNFAATESENGALDAVLLVNPETGEGELLCKNLPKIDGEYQLVIVDDSGRMETLMRFQATTARFHQALTGHGPIEGLQLAVVSVERGAGSPRMLLRTHVI